jgi:hypothetical protein
VVVMVEGCVGNQVRNRVRWVWQGLWAAIIRLSHVPVHKQRAGRANHRTDAVLDSSRSLLNTEIFVNEKFVFVWQYFHFIYKLSTLIFFLIFILYTYSILFFSQLIPLAPNFIRGFRRRKLDFG